MDALTAATTLKICNLIVNDSTALNRWMIIKHVLIGDSYREKLRSVTKTMCSQIEETILDTLEKWVALRHQQAKVCVLAKVLKKHNLNVLAGTLVEKLGPDCRVLSSNGLRVSSLLRNYISTPDVPQGISIISKDASNRVKFEIQGLCSILDQVKGHPVSIISVNGKARSGKSFLLNACLKYLECGHMSNNWMEKQLTSEFPWRGGMDRITQGIQIWSKPYIRDIAAGQGKVAVILMDTQGIFDRATTLRDSAIIFAFSLLLSSVTILNITGGIDSDIFEFFELCLEFSKLTNVQNDITGLEKTLPALTLLIRDWQHPTSFGFGYHDIQQCPINKEGNNRNLNEYIFEEDGWCKSAEVQASLDNIKSAFRNIATLALPYPGKKLVQEDSKNDWDKEFKEHLQSFVVGLFSEENLKKGLKILDGKAITGKQLKSLALAWASVLAEPDDLPPIRTILETTAEIQGNAKIEEAKNFYVMEIKKLLTRNTILQIDFDKVHNSIYQGALALLRQKIIGGKIRQDELVARFESEIDMEYRHLKSLNNNFLAMKSSDLFVATASLKKANKRQKCLQAIRSSRSKTRNEFSGTNSQITTRGIEKHFNQGGFNCAGRECELQLGEAEEKVRFAI